MADITIAAVEEFKQAWAQGIESIIAACDIYVETIDKDKNAKKQFMDAMPKINSSGWSLIENIGRGNTYHGLLFDQSSISDKLIRLPYSEQKSAYESGIEVLTDNGDVLKVNIENLTTEFTKQVFAKKHIRDIAAQKAYRESMKINIKLESEKPKELWTIKNKQLVTFGPCSFTRQQLLNILQDIG